MSCSLVYAKRRQAEKKTPKMAAAEMLLVSNVIRRLCRCPNTTLIRKMLFAKSRRPYKRDPWIIEQAKRSKQDKSGLLHWSTV